MSMTIKGKIQNGRPGPVRALDVRIEFKWHGSEPAFDLVGEMPIEVGFGGENHKILLRYSVAKPQPRQQGRPP